MQTLDTEMSANATTDRFAASFAQRRMWFLEHHAQLPGLYHIPMCWRVVGVLDVPALAAALDDLLHRHEALRTGFEEAAGEPVQVVYADVQLALQRWDLSALAPPERSRRADELRNEQACAAFDLARPPLIRAGLTWLGTCPDGLPEHELMLTVHHLVADGWSMAVLVKELGECYTARRDGRQPALTPLPVQYADYAVWQREWLQGAVLDEQLAYWQQRLGDAPAALELPTDRVRGAVSAHRGASLHLDLGETLSGQLRQRALRQGATLFMVLMAGWAAVLARYSGQQELCVGYPVAGRGRPELEGVVGLFVNTLVLRLELPPGQTAAQLIGQVREAVLDADAHQDIPFERIVAALPARRDPARSPLFQTFFAFYSADSGAPTSRPVWPGLQFCPIETDTQTAKFEISMDLRTQNGSIHGNLEFDAQLYDPGTIERLGRHFITLLRGIAEAADVPVAALPILDSVEKAKQMARLYRGDCVVNPLRCVHEMFEDEARGSPDAQAIVCGGESVSYRELRQRVEWGAKRLRAAGVRPETLVAVCLDRSTAYVVAIMAVLAAGGAYVPLDKDSPRERLLEVLIDTAATIVITDECHAPTFADISVDVITLSQPGDLLKDQVDGLSPTESPPFDLRHLVYCLYTSGSTGRPKGALNTHGGMANLAAWFFSTRVLAVPGERVLMASSVTFDLTQKSILATLAFGGTLVIPDGNLADADSVQDAIDRHAPTRISCAPSAFKAYGLPRTGTSLRTIVLGGEQIEPGLAKRIRECGLNLVNSYGPTECSDITASHLACVDDDAAWNVQPLPIGDPIPGARLYLLDEMLDPVPDGIVGEIHIAGSGVGRGYLHRPGLTARQFLPDPYGFPGTLMYATGDLGRLRADGRSIEFMGRRDSQVKIRGMRIELGEIEAVLRDCPGVGEAAVVMTSNEPAPSMLAAYVIAQDGASLNIEDLRFRLGARLPAHMIPTTWGLLDALPLNRSGKLDRRSLSLLATKPQESTQIVPPATPSERFLFRIWAELLSTTAIGRHDNFFVLGGHSLLAMAMAGRIRAESGINISISDCLNAASLADLGARLDAVVPTGAAALPPACQAS